MIILSFFSIFKKFCRIKATCILCAVPLLATRSGIEDAAAELLKLSLPRFYLSPPTDCHLFKARVFLLKVQVTQIFGIYIFSYFKNMGSNRGFHEVFPNFGFRQACLN